ncbi:MAG: hypothetical protein NTW28_19905 [Candidatus Solibacter sp.]|nr:hypothetical protein [Candidatus Solibacter sp.]
MPRSQKPVSEKRLAANRANAAQSTGPRSPGGKARSAQNSRKHGFTASTFAVVRLEDIEDVARLRQDLIACYQPVNSQELFAIERIALAQQSLLRAARLEIGMFTTSLNESMEGNGRPTVWISPLLVNEDMPTTCAQNRNFLLADGFHRLSKESNSWSLFLRYQAQSERLYRRAVEEFDRLKALRQELPNEPIVEAQPEPNETACPPPQTQPAPSESQPGLPPLRRPDGEFVFHSQSLPLRSVPAPLPDPDPNVPAQSRR